MLFKDWRSDIPVDIHHPAEDNHMENRPAHMHLAAVGDALDDKGVLVDSNLHWTL